MSKVKIASIIYAIGIIIGALFFILQLVNFFSIESLTPALERAQVLSALTSVIIILIAFPY